MPNIVTTAGGGVIVVTNVPMNGGDAPFTLQANLGRVLIQATSSTCSIYLSGASLGNAAFSLPVIGTTAPPLMLSTPELQGSAIVFKGPIGQTVQVLEHLSRVN